MIAFEVWRNGQKLCVAGVGKHGVLTQILTWVAHRPGDHRPGDHRPDDQTLGQSERPKAKLSVGGLMDEAYLDWLERSFEVETGDKIQIVIVEVESADEPAQIRNKKTQSDGERDTRARLGAARALLPTPVVEGEFLTSLRGYDEVVAKGALELAVEILGALGELNSCPPQFWDALKQVAVELEMYDHATLYRSKAG